MEPIAANDAALAVASAAMTGPSNWKDSPREPSCLLTLRFGLMFRDASVNQVT